MVVVLSCGLVFLMIAHRLRRIPSAFFCCCKARRNTSMQQPTDFPEPTGPRIPRKNESSLRNDLRTSPSGLYLKLVNPVIRSELNHTFNNLRANNGNNFVSLSVCAKLFWMVSKVYLLHYCAKHISLLNIKCVQKTHI